MKSRRVWTNRGTKTSRKFSTVTPKLMPVPPSSMMEPALRKSTSIGAIQAATRQRWVDSIRMKLRAKVDPAEDCLLKRAINTARHAGSPAGHPPPGNPPAHARLPNPPALRPITIRTNRRNGFDVVAMADARKGEGHRPRGGRLLGSDTRLPAFPPPCPPGPLRYQGLMATGHA